jgi:hypothetical protein
VAQRANQRSSRVTLRGEDLTAPLTCRCGLLNSLPVPLDAAGGAARKRLAARGVRARAALGGQFLGRSCGLPLARGGEGYGSA